MYMLDSTFIYSVHSWHYGYKNKTLFCCAFGVFTKAMEIAKNKGVQCIDDLV